MNRNRKHIVRLTESQLQQVIKESVGKILNELHGETRDLQDEENRVREDEMADLYNATADIFEDYFDDQGLHLDDFIEEDGGRTVILYLPDPDIIDYDDVYDDVDARLKEIGWVDENGDGEIYTYTLKYPNINTPANQKKQDDRAKSQDFTDPYIADLKRSPGNKKPYNPNVPKRNNLRQIGIDDFHNDKDYGLSDDELYGKTDWYNQAQINECIRRAIRKVLH